MSATMSLLKSASLQRCCVSCSALENVPPGAGNGWCVADDKELAFVLRIELSIRSQGSGCVSRSQSFLLKDLLFQSPALIDRIHVAVFAVRVDYSILINDRGIDAPLESMRVVRNTCDCSVRIASAAKGVGALEAPFDVQVMIQLADEEGFWACGIGSRPVGRANCIVIAIGP